METIFKVILNNFIEESGRHGIERGVLGLRIDRIRYGGTRVHLLSEAEDTALRNLSRRVRPVAEAAEWIRRTNQAQEAEIRRKRGIRNF